jgi:hypothetical protein
LCAR